MATAPLARRDRGPSDLTERSGGRLLLVAADLFRYTKMTVQERARDKGRGNDDSLMATTDENLMNGLRAGDRRALRVLYERHAEFVFRTAYRFTFDEEEARDITQSVFVTLLESARSFEPRAKLTTWLYRVVVNRCLDHRSAARARLRAVGDDRDQLDKVPAAEETQPDRLVDQARTTQRLRDVLRQLPERQRMALALKLFEELSYEEIAEIMGCSRGTVEALLFRARRSLSAKLRQE
jgi:RNA polymerase sigma-70 factor (ECF subfamily)